jgi:hypothetical protein
MNQENHLIITINYQRLIIGSLVTFCGLAALVWCTLPIIFPDLLTVTREAHILSAFPSSEFQDQWVSQRIWSHVTSHAFALEEVYRQF